MGAERREKLARREKREEALKRSKSRLEERVGSENYNKMSADGLQNPTDKGEYTAAEVKAEFRTAGDKGRSVNDGGKDMVSYFQQQRDNGAKFNFKAQQYLSDKYGMDFSKKKEDPGDKKPPQDGGGNGNDNGNGGSEGKQQSYGLSKKRAKELNQAEGEKAIDPRKVGGKGKDNKATAYAMRQAKLGGGTGIAGDFTGSGADFVEYFSKATENDSDDYIEKHRAEAQARIDGLDVRDTAAMATERARSMQDSKDRATVQSFLNWGDYTNPNYKPPTWENSEVDDVEQPDFEELYKKVIGNLK